jgi:hypothetical protein
MAVSLNINTDLAIVWERVHPRMSNVISEVPDLAKKFYTKGKTLVLCSCYINKIPKEI